LALKSQNDNYYDHKNNSTFIYCPDRNDICNQISNQGVHYFDLLRRLLNGEAPAVISTLGGKYAVDDDRTIPDTMQVTYEFASGSIATVKVLEASSGSFIPYGLIEMRGTKGTL
jgi:predicted dehydrogenase